MKHQQILEKLAAKHLAESITEDVSRLMTYAMAYEKHGSISSRLQYVLPKLLLRWECVLNATSREVSDIYKQKTAVALAVVLHQYGCADAAITDSAVKAIDSLNAGVVLSDDFARKSEAIKTFLLTPPIPLKRKPGLPELITFYRPKDVVAIQLEKRFYIAYIHELTGPNESPILEFCDVVFDKSPTLEDIKGYKAKGQRFKDGTTRIERVAVCGMKHLPDLAYQIKLIAACVNQPPENQHLEKALGLYTVSDLFSLQDTLKRLFADQ
jgi:hypothetical protein